MLLPISILTVYPPILSYSYDLILYIYSFPCFFIYITLMPYIGKLLTTPHKKLYIASIPFFYFEHDPLPYHDPVFEHEQLLL